MFLGLFIIGTLAAGAAALSQVRVSVPDAVLAGEPVTFHCLYDLEYDSLYSVKWYKGRQEFYRFTPKESPPMKTFRVPGVPQLHVQVDKSNATQVTLPKAFPALSGRYSCEVSADAPSFQTALVTGKMDVVTPPKYAPSLHGLRPRYREGDRLEVNCTSSDSSPAANLSWSINGHQVDRKHANVYQTVWASSWKEDLESVTSTLEKTLTAKDFNSNHRIKIRCTASILSVYWKTAEKSAELERPKESSREHQPHLSVLMNLKTDVETIPDVVEYEPTRVTVQQTSGASVAAPLVLLKLLSWRSIMFRYSLPLTQT